MKSDNQVVLEFPSHSSNEAFARVAAAGFAMQLDPTLEELGDIKTAVSEAVTNAIVHGYPENFGKIVMKLRIREGNILQALRHRNRRHRHVPSVARFLRAIHRLRLAASGFLASEGSDLSHAPQEIHDPRRIRRRVKGSLREGSTLLELCQSQS